MSSAKKKILIEPDHRFLSVHRQCELLSLSRSSYYREAAQGEESEENLALMRIIDEEYMKHPFYGSRKMRTILHRKGFVANRKRIQRLMRKMGIQSVAPGPHTSKGRSEHKIYPYLLRYLTVE